jgi:hypothetical protein
MAAVDTVVETWLSPDEVREALLDFSEQRPDIWPGLTPELYEVYEVGATSAFVKEGTKFPVGTVWAKERYDWSDPDTIRWTVEESNFCTPGSYVAATLHPREDGGTRIEVHWQRTGTNTAAQLMAFAIVATKGKPVAGSIEKALRRLEDVRRLQRRQAPSS